MHARILERSPASNSQQELNAKEQKRRNDLTIKLKNKLEDLVSDPVNAGFYDRGAANCALACKLSPQEAAKIKNLNSTTNGVLSRLRDHEMDHMTMAAIVIAAKRTDAPI